MGDIKGNHHKAKGTQMELAEIAAAAGAAWRTFEDAAEVRGTLAIAAQDDARAATAYAAAREAAQAAFRAYDALAAYYEAAKRA